MKIIFFFIVLLFFSSNAQKQDIKVTYVATLNNDDLIYRIINDPVLFNSKDVRRERLKIELSKKSIHFELVFNETEALFKMDSTVEVKSTYGINPTEMASNADRTYYSNNKTEEKFWISDIITPGIFIHLDKVNWKLTTEAKEIGGYLCHKATTIISKEQPSGNKYLEPVEAWYTKEIPTSFGILNFHDLPGLTLELTYNRKHDGRVTFLVKEIDTNPKKKSEVKKPEGTQDMTEEEYVALIKRLNTERMARRLNKN